MPNWVYNQIELQNREDTEKSLNKPNPKYSIAANLQRLATGARLTMIYKSQHSLKEF